MGELISMGGYGGYIWSAYGLSTVALAGLTLLSWRDHRIAKRRARELDAEPKT